MSERSKRILAAIKAMEYSYGELEKVTGIPKSALQRYATGETEKIPLDRLEAIARATNVSPEYLLGWDTSSTSYTTPMPMDETIKAYLLLNDLGREKANKYVLDLVSKKKYTVTDVSILPIAARGPEDKHHVMLKQAKNIADRKIKKMPSSTGDKDF